MKIRTKAKIHYSVRNGSLISQGIRTITESFLDRYITEVVKQK